MKIIDPHLHLFNLSQGDYHWLKSDNPPFWPDKKLINKSFSEKELYLDSANELAGFVHIEAGFDNNKPWREIDWLESYCKKPFRAVASIDITLPFEKFTQHLSKLATYSSVVGCRYILDEHAAELLARIEVQENLALLAHKNLSFDVQMPLSDKSSVQALINILELSPTLKVIINHAGWPPSLSENTNDKSIFEGNNLSNTKYADWLVGIKKISEYSQCAIKCSGWEIVNRQFTRTWQTQILKHCISHFGIDRVMLASNFPLCIFTQNYQDLWRSYVNNLSLSQQHLAALCCENVVKWYKFKL